MKVLIKYSLVNSEEKLSQTLKGLNTKGIIKFKDNLVNFEINPKLKYLKRYNDYFEIYISFEDSYYLLKSDHKKLNLPIIIKEFSTCNNHIEIIYEINNDNFIFKLDYEVI